MQIKIRYDYQTQTVEVPEEECESMIRNDYEERLAAAEDPSTVQPRTMQEIMDERFNKPEYNSIHKQRKHTRSLDCFDMESNDFANEEETLGSDLEQKEMVCALHEAMKTLLPEQIELIQRIYFDGECAKDVAEDLGITKQALNNRLNKIYDQIRKKFCLGGFTEAVFEA